MLVISGKIKFVANTAIDLSYTDDERDFLIKDFVEDHDFRFDFSALRARGIDLHEMYTQELPLNLKDAQEMGIEQDFYLLDIYRIKEVERIQALRSDTEMLKKNRDFLHGFFGDQNIFGRRKAYHLPFRYWKIL